MPKFLNCHTLQQIASANHGCLRINAMYCAQTVQLPNIINVIKHILWQICQKIYKYLVFLKIFYFGHHDAIRFTQVKNYLKNFNLVSSNRKSHHWFFTQVKNFTQMKNSPGWNSPGWHHENISWSWFFKTGIFFTRARPKVFFLMRSFKKF